MNRLWVRLSLMIAGVLFFVFFLQFASIMLEDQGQAVVAVDQPPGLSAREHGAVASIHRTSFQSAGPTASFRTHRSGTHRARYGGVSGRRKAVIPLRMLTRAARASSFGRIASRSVSGRSTARPWPVLIHPS